MKGYVAQKGDRFYAVIYKGLDPVTGRERRRWHPAGTNRDDAERLAADQQGRADAVRALTFGAYLTRQWLPGKKLQLAPTTFKSYERNVEDHIIPALGHIRLRRLRYPQIETFYDHLLAPTADRPGLSPKTVYGIHLIIRGSLTEAVRRGLVNRNVALVARSPRLKAIATTDGRSWTDEQLRRFLRASAGHRFFPILWLSATTGMRRYEVLGLTWPDIDLDKRRLCVDRGLVSVGYEVAPDPGQDLPAHHRPRRHDRGRAVRPARVPGRPKPPRSGSTTTTNGSRSSAYDAAMPTSRSPSRPTST